MARALRLGLATIVICSLACAGGTRSPGHTARLTVGGPPTASSSAKVGPDKSGYLHPDLAARTALFERMRDATRTLHAFSTHTEKGLGFTWDSLLPDLQKRFETAEDRLALLRALTAFGRSLHNPHAGFVGVKWPGTDRSLSLGLRLMVDVNTKTFHVSRVTDPTVFTVIHEGDKLISADGIAMTEALSKLAWISDGNQPQTILHDIANWLTTRRAPEFDVSEGKVSALVFEPAKGTPNTPITVEVKWGLSPSNARGEAAETDYDYTRKDCLGLRHPNLSAYKLESHGIGFCLYVAEKEPHRSFPVVRQFTFSYRDRGFVDGMRADWFHLRSELAALGKAKGVLLDLRDNGGGNNPVQFLSWWMPKPFLAPFISTRPKLGVFRESHAVISPTGPLSWLEGRSATDFEHQTRWFCTALACTDGSFTARNPLTDRPVALLLGPQCGSACDTFAQIFAENHAGPLVGEPNAASASGVRISIPVKTAESFDLGSLELVVARVGSGITGERFEGRPVEPTTPVPRTAANAVRDYDRLLIDAAIAALKKWPQK